MTKTLYKIRCHPECPFPDCVILTDIPPVSEEEQDGQEGQEGEQGDNNSSSDSRSGGNSSSMDEEQGSEGDSQEGDGTSEGESKDGGEGQQSDSGDQKKPQKPREKQDRRADPIPPKPDKKEQDKPEPKDQGNNGQDRTAEKLQPKKSPKPFKVEKITVPDNVQYGYEALPDDFKKSERSGQSAGLDDTGIADLGRHKFRETIVTDAVFQAQLKNVLKDNAFDRPVRGRKRGHLDMRSLYRVPMKAENIFTLKEARKNKHYNVILLVDQSGSMFDGITMNEAAKVATFLARSLERVGINYAIIGYSSEWAYHKKFSQLATDDMLKKINYDLLHTGGGGTALTGALKQAFTSLKPLDGKNIVISISDGQPNAPELDKQYIRGNAHVADYIDIGIRNRPLIKSGFQVTNVTEVKPLLIRQLRKRIRRG